MYKKYTQLFKITIIVKALEIKLIFRMFTDQNPVQKENDIIRNCHSKFQWLKLLCCSRYQNIPANPLHNLSQVYNL